ncbi:hypothetical protein KGQ29_02995, partial [Patescibacteria group bacterium]|nr:hypothetical protein [Patescibacteria group bacterium]
EGSIFSVMAAYLYPERFRNLVLVDPAGMIGKDNLPRLASGFSIDLIKQIISEMTKEKPTKDQTTGGGPLDALKAANVLIKSPLQAIRSVFAIANSDIRNMLKSIKEKGIGISVIHPVDDRAFPMEKMQEALGVEHLDGFYSVKGSHNSYFLDPKPYTLLIDNALDDLEKKSKERLI